MIWFDVDNSPHVPLIRAIVGRLRTIRDDIEYTITARRHAQTVDLLDMWRVPHTVVGTHGGKSSLGKVRNLLQRSRLLVDEMRGRDISLAVSHGSRAQVLA